MARPIKCRLISGKPGSDYFKPRGVPLFKLQEVELSLDEFEAIRLADLEGLYQEEAAQKMGVSRQTFGNIMMNAHQKIASALVYGKALKLTRKTPLVFPAAQAISDKFSGTHFPKRG